VGAPPRRVPTGTPNPPEPPVKGSGCIRRSSPTPSARPTPPGSSSSTRTRPSSSATTNKAANDTVALLGAEAGRDPYDRELSDLIGQLSTRSDDFRWRWAAHNVRIHTSGVKLLHHPVVGDLDLPFESFPLPADPSQSLLIYTAEPRSPTQDALNLLASWAATADNVDLTRPTKDSRDGVPSPKAD
jgi:transcription regulator MmyB-like protein